MAPKLLPHGHYQAQDLVRFRCDVVQRGLLFAIKETLRLGEQPWSNWATLRAHALEQEPYDAEYAIVLADLRLDSEPAYCVLWRDGGAGPMAIKLLDRLVGPGMIGTHGPGIPFTRAVRADVRRRVLTVNGKHSVILGEDNAIPERRM